MKAKCNLHDENETQQNIKKRGMEEIKTDIFIKAENLEQFMTLQKY
jgi:hypothetical protein